MAKNNSSMAIFAVAAAGGAAFLLTRSAKASTPSEDKDPTEEKDEKKDVDIPDHGKAHATIGSPYVPGDEGKNVQIAVATKPIKHPVGLSKGTRTDADWLANVAFWETYPTGPIVIPSASEYAAIWKRIRAAVVAALKPKSGTDTTPKGHATLGTPYRPGRASVEHNVKTVVEKRPEAHPVGKKGMGTNPDWLANFVYWESYPLSPITITSSTSADAKEWKRIKALIVKAIADLNKKTETTPNKKTETTPNKKTETTPNKKTELSPTLGQPYRPGSDQERNNAAIAVRTKPSHHPRGEARKAGQADADWLANVAFWEAWPAAPTKIPKGSAFAPIWTRIRNYVVQELKKPVGSTKKADTTPTKKTTPTTPGGPKAGDLAGNARIAIAKFKTENDRTNNAYYWTWPDAPKKIPEGDKLNSGRWLEAQAKVRSLLNSSTTTTTTTTTTIPTAKTEPGNLVINVAQTLRHGADEKERTNLAYWATWPNSPKKIPKGDKLNADHWLLAQEEVRRQMPLNHTFATGKLAAAAKEMVDRYGDSQAENKTIDLIVFKAWPKARKNLTIAQKTDDGRWWMAQRAMQEAFSAKAKSKTQKTTPATPKAGDLPGNARIAVSQFATANDRANNAYWWTWPDAPKKIPKGDKASAKKWNDAMAEVKRIGGISVAGDIADAPPAFATLDKADPHGARELAESAKAVTIVPSGPKFVERAANLALEKAYPKAESNPAYMAAAQRVLSHVQRAAKVLSEVDPAGSELGRLLFQRLAAIMANASQHRTPKAIETAIKAAEIVAKSSTEPLKKGLDPVAYVAQIATAGEGAPLSRSYWAAAQL